MNVKKYTVFLAVLLMMLRVQALFAGPDIREDIPLRGAPSGQYESQENGWTTPEA